MNFRLILSISLLLSTPVFAVDAEPAAAEPATTAEAPPVLKLPELRADMRRSKALAQQLQPIDKETQVLWLGSGEEEFLGLYLPDHSGATFASALILHDNRQHPDWPGVVRQLRVELAAHGWNTLAISLPDYLYQPEIPAMPAKTDIPPSGATPTTATGTAPKPEKTTTGQPAPQKAENDPPATAAKSAEADPDDAIEEKPVEYPYQQIPDIVDARAREAIGYLKEKSAKQPIVIVALGLAAGIAEKKAQSMLISDIAGLIIIDPVQPEGAEFKTELDAMDLRIPVLDIVPEFYPRTDPALRLNSATRLKHQHYQQRVIKGARPNFDGMETLVVKSVRGWGERLFSNPEQ